MFRDRVDAGRQLAGRLSSLQGQDVVVLGLPRGGVPVAAEVARALHAPLDVIVVRKLGVPFQPELAMGAVGEGGVLVVNDDVLGSTRVRRDEWELAAARERAEVDRRAVRFRSHRPGVPLAGRVALVVDDGMATGATARAACRVARAMGASRVVLAVPVAATDAASALRREADEVVCVAQPQRLRAVGDWYQDFAQVSDERVSRLLRPVVQDRRRDQDVEVDAGSCALGGHLVVPRDVRGVVLFAHGSGSGRDSPRHRAVASVLQGSGLATLLLDLLTPREELSRSTAFDVPLLASRLAGATRWAIRQPGLDGLPVGFVGASTGAAAALWAATEPDVPVKAVVSRGGRPDLAAERLPLVTAPTLLVVGAKDRQVLELNRQAMGLLRCRHRLEVVPGATHLFEEPGALARVARLAGDWFLAHLARDVRRDPGDAVSHVP